MLFTGPKKSVSFMYGISELNGGDNFFYKVNELDI